MKNALLLVIVIFLFFIYCEKKEYADIKPVISLNTETDYVSTDTSLGVGQQYKVGILANSESGENLTNLIIKSNGIRIFDNGYNAPTLSEEILLTKTTEETERLTFIIRNKARLADSLTITIKKTIKDYSVITRYSSILLGCHQNTSIGNYYSFSNNQIYTQSEAYNNQELIDLIYFYDATGDENTLGSPGANLTGILTGIDSPDNWTIQKTTRYSRSPIIINENEFLNVQNDSLILANLFTDGGRKAKNLAAGQYYGFVNEENKYGIIKIESIAGREEGTVGFSIIIQK